MKLTSCFLWIFAKFYKKSYTGDVLFGNNSYICT